MRVVPVTLAAALVSAAAFAAHAQAPVSLLPPGEPGTPLHVEGRILGPGGPVANGHGYFMAKFDAGTEIDLIVLLDASGAELESYPFRR